MVTSLYSYPYSEERIHANGRCMIQLCMHACMHGRTACTYSYVQSKLSIIGRHPFSDTQTNNLLKQLLRKLACILFQISVFRCQKMELKCCIIAMIELFKVAVRNTPLSDDHTLLSATALQSYTKRVKILQPLLSVRVTHVLSKEPQFVTILLLQGKP